MLSQHLLDGIEKPLLVCLQVGFQLVHRGLIGLVNPLRYAGGVGIRVLFYLALRRRGSGFRRLGLRDLRLRGRGIDTARLVQFRVLNAGIRVSKCRNAHGILPFCSVLWFATTTITSRDNAPETESTIASSIMVFYTNSGEIASFFSFS